MQHCTALIRLSSRSISSFAALLSLRLEANSKCRDVLWLRDMLSRCCQNLSNHSSRSQSFPQSHSPCSRAQTCWFPSMPASHCLSIAWPIASSYLERSAITKNHGETTNQQAAKPLGSLSTYKTLHWNRLAEGLMYTGCRTSTQNVLRANLLFWRTAPTANGINRFCLTPGL